MKWQRISEHSEDAWDHSWYSPELSRMSWELGSEIQYDYSEISCFVTWAHGGDTSVIRSSLLLGGTLCTNPITLLFQSQKKPDHIFGMRFSTFLYLVLQTHNFSASHILVSLLTLNSSFCFSPLLFPFTQPCSWPANMSPPGSNRAMVKCFSHSFRCLFLCWMRPRELLFVIVVVFIFSRLVLWGQESWHRLFTTWKCNLSSYSKGIKIAENPKGLAGINSVLL